MLINAVRACPSLKTYMHRFNADVTCKILLYRPSIDPPLAIY